MPNTSLRVAQLNIGSLLEPGWDDRRHEIVAWVRRLEPDVVCFEEVWEDPNTQNTAGWIAEATPEFDWYWAFGGAPFGPDLWPDPQLRFGSAVLSRWPIDSATHHLLPTVTEADPFVANVPWELFHVSTAGLDIFACHLAALPTHGYHRRVQVLAIDEIIAGVRGDTDAMPGVGQLRDGMPPILCGDFNAEPESDEIRFLSSLATLEGRTAFYQDAWRVAGEGPGYTQDWRTNQLAEQMNLHRKRVDYVFVGDPYHRRGGAGRVLSVATAFDQQLTGIDASDHAGLVVDVLWPDRPTGE